MAASLLARDKVYLASQLQIAQQSFVLLPFLSSPLFSSSSLTSSNNQYDRAATAVNPTAAFQVSIFRGDFLDWRSTLVFGFFFAVGTFVMGLLRANNDKLTLVAVSPVEQREEKESAELISLFLALLWNRSLALSSWM